MPLRARSESTEGKSVAKEREGPLDPEAAKLAAEEAKRQAESVNRLYSGVTASERAARPSYSASKLPRMPYSADRKFLVDSLMPLAAASGSVLVPVPQAESADFPSSSAVGRTHPTSRTLAGAGMYLVEERPYLLADRGERWLTQDIATHSPAPRPDDRYIAHGGSVTSGGGHSTAHSGTLRQQVYEFGASPTPHTPQGVASRGGGGGIPHNSDSLVLNGLSVGTRVSPATTNSTSIGSKRQAYIYGNNKNNSERR